MDEPHWLSRTIVDSIHFEQLQEHGGALGMRDENTLESAIARPRNKRSYDRDSDPASLAAAYGFGLATAHGHTDGNKRVAFLAMYVFLGLNGWELEASEVEVVAVMRAVASGGLGEEELAAWVRDHLVSCGSNARA